MTPGAQDDLATTDGPELADVLARGTLEVVGRISGSSNVTLLARCCTSDVEVTCVYKPVAGERPLHDFPDGTLAAREVAAHVVSQAAGWDVVPTTVLREGPFGPGSVQRWVHPPVDAPVDEEVAEDGILAHEEAPDFLDEASLLGEPGAGLVDVVAFGSVPAGWRHVMDAWGYDGEPVALVHADDPRLLSMAVFDVVANNADRKGGHVLLGRPALAGGSPRVHGIDHGLVLHSEPKLRTVLWGWAGDALPEVEVDALLRLRSALAGPSGAELAELLTAREVRALRSRTDRLLHSAVLPAPPASRSAVPWPVF